MVRELLVRVEPLGWRVTGLTAKVLRRVELAWGRLALRAEVRGEPVAPDAVAREAAAFRRLHGARGRDPSR